MLKRRGLIYGILVGLILIMGVWWIYFLSQEGEAHAQVGRQKLANDRLHAAFLLESDPQVKAEPEKLLSEYFPELVFVRHADRISVEINPATLQAIDAEARATRNMFLYEGLFFLALLIAGSTILILSWRSEARFVQARELFLAGATHEFKTPLASLRLYTETLGREGLTESHCAGIRSRMVEDIARLENLVNEVLSLSADDTFSMGPQIRVDLVAEAESVLRDLRPLARDRDAELTFRAAGKHLILGHEVPFALALRNLVANAIKHGPASVKVTVEIRRHGSNHHVIVQDNGPGIPRHLQEKVFDCFYSADRQGRPAGGSGLGLYLVQRNTRSLHGSVKLESEDGAGATFTMILPAHEGDG